MALLAVLLSGLLGVFGGALAPAQAAASPGAFAPDGVLFFPSVGGLLPSLKAPHFCSASVVHSAGHDLVITAAHCLYGSGPTIEFAPGFNGSAPHGIWEVTRIYVESAWESSQSPTSDVAFLQVAPLKGHQIEDVVGARPLGVPAAGLPVKVSGFPMQSNTPSICTNSLSLTQGYPSISCSGAMTDGVSGGAWVQGGAVVGVVGGLEQGGCSPQVAYSAPFGSTVEQLWQRAQAGASGDIVLPGFLANSCS